MAGDINIVAIVKGEERYVFMFDEDSRAETLRTLGRYASNPDLSFSWYDAAVLSQKIRKTCLKGKPASEIAPPPHFGHASSHDEARATEGHSSFWPDPDLDWPLSDEPWIGDDPIA